MKNFGKTVVVFAVTVVATLAWSSLFAQRKAVRLTRFVNENITGVDISGPFKVEISQGPNSSAVVEVSSDRERDLVFDNRGGVVVVRFKRRGGNHSDINTVRVTLRQLDVLTLSGAVSVDMKTPVSANRCNIAIDGISSLRNVNLQAKEARLDVSGTSYVEMVSFKADDAEVNICGASSTDMDMAVNSANLSVSGATRMKLSGTVGKCVVNVSGGSQVNGGLLTAAEAEVSVSGGASCRMGVKERLGASVSGGGRFVYNGSPVINSLNVSPGGYLRQGSK